MIGNAPPGQNGERCLRGTSFMKTRTVWGHANSPRIDPEECPRFLSMLCVHTEVDSSSVYMVQKVLSAGTLTRHRDLVPTILQFHANDPVQAFCQPASSYSPYPSISRISFLFLSWPLIARILYYLLARFPIASILWRVPFVTLTQVWTLV